MSPNLADFDKFSKSTNFSWAPNLVGVLPNLVSGPSWPKLWPWISWACELGFECHLRHWNHDNKFYILVLVSMKSDNFDFWSFPKPSLISKHFSSHLDHCRYWTIYVLMSLCHELSMMHRFHVVKLSMMPICCLSFILWCCWWCLILAIVKYW